MEERSDGLTITPGPLRPAEIDPHGDHRLAMSLVLAGLAAPGVVICDPDCTAKPIRSSSPIWNGSEAGIRGCESL